MKWQKLGRIASHKTLDLPWFKRYSMVPLPYRLDDSRLRIFLTMCDAENRGQIAYVDVDPDEPTRLLGHSTEPLLGPGPPGMFDDNGVVTSALFETDDKLYLYYSGYELGTHLPYNIHSGLAVSEDRGESFQRVSSVPILQRSEHEIFCKCAPYVIAQDEGYRVYYVGDQEPAWVEHAGHKKPVYDLKTFQTDRLYPWGRMEGEVSVELNPDGDEHGIAKADIWLEDGLFRMLYSLRTLTNGYRLGYAESEDGIHFTRLDDQVGIQVSDSGWDSEMICFPSRYQHGDRTYLFYCGNQYGLAGFGVAELQGND